MAVEKYIFTVRLGEELVRLRVFSGLENQRRSWSIVRHSNVDYDLHLFLSGTCLVDVEGHQVRVGAGQGLIIAPERYHAPLSTDGQLDHLPFTLSVSHGPLAEKLAAKADPYALFDIPQEAFGVYRAIFREYSARNPFQRTMLQTMLTELLIHVLRALDLTVDRKLPFGGQTAFDRMDLIDLHFANHYADNGMQAQLAERMHLSPRQLGRFIQEHYGMTYQQRLTQTRVEQAKHMLSHTDTRISDIAVAVGYSSEAAFYSAFRSLTGLTPRQYRVQRARQKEPTAK